MVSLNKSETDSQVESEMGIRTNIPMKTMEIAFDNWGVSGMALGAASECSQKL